MQKVFTTAEIIFLRSSRFLTQRQLADKMDISFQRYSAMERSGEELPPDSMTRILNALGYSWESARKLVDSIPPFPSQPLKEIKIAGR